jgi:ketosteroid isomerase-like protein
MRFALLATTLLALCAHPTASVPEDEQIVEARRFFDRFAELEQSFDPDALDLYSDDALIVITYKDPGGRVERVIRLSGAQYKEESRPHLATARDRVEPAKYIDLEFVSEAEGVRINGRRHLKSRRFKGSYSLLIQRDASGSWKIVEERGESIRCWDTGPGTIPTCKGS